MSHDVHRLTPLVAFFAELRRQKYTVVPIPKKLLHPSFRARGLYVKRILAKTQEACDPRQQAALSVPAPVVVPEAVLLDMEKVTELSPPSFAKPLFSFLFGMRQRNEIFRLLFLLRDFFPHGLLLRIELLVEE